MQTLLQTRHLKGLLHLHPADHGAGAPYDAAILTLSLLTEGEHFSPAYASRIGRLAQRAQTGAPDAIRAIEQMAMATLSLGKQLDYRSLTTLAPLTDSPRDWADMATLFRAYPEAISPLYTALTYRKEPQTLKAYLTQHTESGLADIHFAITQGPAALDYLLDESLPRHERSTFASWIHPLIERARPSALTQLTVTNRELALTAKFTLLLGAGFASALAATSLGRGRARRGSRPISATSPTILARNFFVAGAVAIVLWVLFEPAALKTPHAAPTESGPRIEFTMASALESLQSPVKTMNELNQVTVLVLALFFIIQLVIYCLCLIKIKEIAKQSIGPAVKLRLLDNEENLFDFGLYVGLGGTVLSLIMVAVNLVEPSLMAAYASTLFGIIFVALLKVIHLRTFRRQLILDLEREQPTTAQHNLMGNIEL